MASVEQRRLERIARRVSYKLRQALEILHQELGWFNEEELENTPYRIAKYWVLELASNQCDSKEFKMFESGHDELIIVKGIHFSSLCSHHLMPFEGVVDVGYLPKEKVLGLSKIPRLVFACAAQPCLQEDLTERIVDTLLKAADPRFAIVRVEAKHSCCISRGAKARGSTMTTIAVRYDKEDELMKEGWRSLKHEFLSEVLSNNKIQGGV